MISAVTGHDSFIQSVGHDSIAASQKINPLKEIWIPSQHMCRFFSSKGVIGFFSVRDWLKS
jgi:hypothetical protein